MLLEIRYAYRMLRNTPAFTLIAGLILAVGIGANTAVFSALNTLLFTPLPHPNADRIVIAGERNLRTGLREATSMPTFRAWRERGQSFESLAAIEPESVFTLPGAEAGVPGARVTSEFFRVLGIQMAVGRGFTSSDPANAVVVSQRLWREHMAGNIDLSRRRIGNYDVIGVLPPKFKFGFAKTDIVARLDEHSLAPDRSLRVVGLLRPGVSASQARAELEATLPSSGDERLGAWTQTLRDFTVGDRGPLGAVLLATVALVLVIACMNIGIIQLARAVSRQREAAMRLALGATAAHVARLSVWEGLLLGCAGGAGGWALAYTIARVARAVAPEFEEIALDARVLSFTAALSVVTGLIFGTAPAMLAYRLNVNETLKTGALALTGARMRKVFVAAQTAMALTLLTGAGALLSTFARLTATDPGFRSDHIVVAELSVPSLRNASAEMRRAESERLSRSVQAIPGVRTAAVASSMPLFGISPCRFSIEGRADSDAMSAGCRPVSHTYFELFGIPLRAGRTFTGSDSEGSRPVAIINRRLAALFWPGSDPVGSFVRIGGERIEIVGIAADVRSVGLIRPAIPEIYRPLRQSPPAEVSVAIRSAVDPLTHVAELRRTVQGFSAGAAVRYVNSMPALLEEQVALVKWLSLFSAIFAAIALVMAGAGLYGVVSFLTAQRTHEIGIRVALGATPAGIVRLVFASCAKMATVGVPAGVLGGLALAAALGSLLSGTALPTVTVIGAAVVVVCAAGAVAIWMPARRAAALDPLQALRQE